MLKMSDTDDSAVLVEHNDAPELQDEDDSFRTDDDTPQAYQIVSIGSEEDAYAFHFEQDKLNEILSRVPAGWKVAVVSVLGAFRTGKSFLLSWFLRYLHHLKQVEEGTAPDDQPWYEQFQSLGNDGFEWKAGSERYTTGIWMWSHPHFIKSKDDSEYPTAVLLVDTQGMFDHETTMALTASIFGFSTLLSSYQIYNVDKRIQEDNLQQLALFSEYARTAMTTDAKSKDEKEEGEPRKPFQLIEFLVRDWQHFEEEEDYAAMENDMEEYLQNVIAERDAKDLQDTREQILSCFQSVSCYGLCHPGFAVTKKKYTGNVNVIEPLFVKLLDRYCARVFDPEMLEPKIIGGRELSAVELGSYIQAYAELFASGATFPTAATLLEATASANNTNAVHMAVANYKEAMDHISGPHCSNYIRPEELKDEHKLTVAKSLEVFDSIATFGGQKSIDEAREKLMQQLGSAFEVYESLNNGRNPLAGLETYVRHDLYGVNCLL